MILTESSAGQNGVKITDENFTCNFVYKNLIFLMVIFHFLLHVLNLVPWEVIIGWGNGLALNKHQAII